MARSKSSSKISKAMVNAMPRKRLRAPPIPDKNPSNCKAMDLVSQLNSVDDETYQSLLEEVLSDPKSPQAVANCGTGPFSQKPPIGLYCLSQVWVSVG